MRHVYGNAFATTNEIRGHARPGQDIIVPPYKWVGCVRHLWPIKLDKVLAHMGEVDERTARRWMAGEFPLPAAVWFQIIQEMNKREGQ